MTAPAALLDALLIRYWHGGVTQAKAAQLLGIRRAEFVELADLRKCVAIIETHAWRYFLQAFNERFPECDRRAVYRPVADGRAFAARMYTDADLLAPPDRFPDAPK